MQQFPDASTSAGKAQLQVASTIFDTTQAKYGFNYNAAIAAMANAFAESSLICVIAGDESAAHGLWQLHDSRRADILKAIGVDMGADGAPAQCHGLAWELTQKANKFLGWAKIQAAKTPEDAAEAFCRLYERPANVEADVALRRAYATMFAAHYPKVNA